MSNNVIYIMTRFIDEIIAFILIDEQKPSAGKICKFDIFQLVLEGKFFPSFLILEFQKSLKFRPFLCIFEAISFFCVSWVCGRLSDYQGEAQVSKGVNPLPPYLRSNDQKKHIFSDFCACGCGPDELLQLLAKNIKHKIFRERLRRAFRTIIYNIPYYRIICPIK